MIDLLFNQTRVLQKEWTALPSRWYPWRVLVIRTPRFFILKGKSHTYLLTAPTKFSLSLKDDGFGLEIMVLGFGFTYTKHIGY